MKNKTETPAAINGTWYKFPCSYFEDSRTYKLRRLVGDSALWVMPRLWSFAVTHGGSGDLSEYESSELADAIRYQDDSQKLLDALKTVGYLDTNGMLTGWDELFGLARSRKESAIKAGIASGKKRSAAVSPYTSSEREEEKREEEKRVECDVERHVEHTRTTASPVLSETESAELVAKFKTTPEAIAEAWKDHTAIERRYRKEPTAETFRAYLLKDGKDTLRRHRTESTDGELPEPKRYAEWWAQTMNGEPPPWLTHDKTNQQTFMRMHADWLKTNKPIRPIIPMMR